VFGLVFFCRALFVSNKLLFRLATLSAVLGEVVQCLVLVRVISRLLYYLIATLSQFLILISLVEQVVFRVRFLKCAKIMLSHCKCLQVIIKWQNELYMFFGLRMSGEVRGLNLYLHRELIEFKFFEPQLSKALREATHNSEIVH
jgi:hypothetical protein